MLSINEVSINEVSINMSSMSVLSFSRAVCLAAALLSPAVAFADDAACNSSVLSAMPVRPTLIAPVAIELAPATTQLGGITGVLSQASDEALSVDNVLLRIRQDGCLAVARAAASRALDPNDPASYKPKTEFDNTPWRFNMTQNGKRMTADEFDAWMKSRGVRVVGRKDPVPALVPPSSETAVPVMDAPEAKPQGQ